MLSRSTTAGLFAAVVIAAVAVWFVRQNVLPEGGAPRERLLLAAGVEPYDSIELEGPGGTLACQLRQGTWWLTRPVAARADDERIHRLLDALAVAPVLDVITPDEQRYRAVSQRDYGLAEPQRRIVLRGPAVSPLELRIGTLAPHGQSLYVGFTGSPRIWVTDPDLLTVLPEGIGDVRDRTLLPYPSSRLRRFELRTPGNPLIALERDPDGQWRIRQPESRRADPQAVEALLGYVADTKILSFVHTADRSEEGAATAADLGIAYGCTPDEAILTARFWYTGARSGFEFHELLAGKPALDSSDSVYLLSTEEGLVVTVPNTFPHALKVPPDVLRDHRLWPVAPADVSRVGLKSESGSVVVSRGTDGTWALNDPIQAPADPAVCSNMVTRIATLKDIGMADQTEPARYDLAVEWTFGTPSQTCTALVSKVAAPEGTGTGFDWFLPAAGTTQRVAGDALPADFGSSAFFASLRDRSVLQLGDTPLAALTIQTGTNLLVQATPGPDGSWTVQPSASTGPQTSTIGTVLAACRDLRAARVEALAPASLDPYGLREPSFLLTFRFRDPTTPPRLLSLGSPTTEGGRYALLKGQDSVFVLSPQDTDLLTAPASR